MSDAYNGLVTLLLRMEGSDGSPYFRDDSNFPKIVTVNGNAAISTAQSKWGNGSGYSAGTGGFLTITHADMALGTGDFSLEVWCWRSAAPETYVDMLMHFLDTTGMNFEWTTNNTLGLFLHATPTSYDTGSATFNLSAWNHVALTRQSNIFRGFLNGVLQFTREVTKNFTATVFYLGHDPINANRVYGAGYLQDFRITKGVARYTANFTPPSRLENPANPLNLSLTTQYYDASGWYRIKGSVVELGVAGSYRVRLFERQTGRLIREMWSASDGAYAFNYIPYIANGYYVIAFDHGNNPLNAAIADLVTPELMP